MHPRQESNTGPATRHLDTRLQTWLAPEVLQRRLLGHYLDARMQEEETGAIALFLTMGFLQSYETY